MPALKQLGILSNQLPSVQQKSCLMLKEDWGLRFSAWILDAFDEIMLFPCVDAVTLAAVQISARCYNFIASGQSLSCKSFWPVNLLTWYFRIAYNKAQLDGINWNSSGLIQPFMKTVSSYC